MTQNMTITPPPAAGTSLASKVAFLRQPTSFPESGHHVDAIESHMSWVFLTEQYAYKLKKPVHRGPLDFRTVEARHFYCKEEVRLNRRLAPRVYLGIVALAIDAVGHLRLYSGGTVTDWLVKMRRLPAHQMLDYAIKTGSAREGDLARVAALLAQFYRRCPPISVDPVKYRGHLGNEIEDNRRSLCTPAYRLPPDRIDRICLAQQAVVQRLSSLFEQRIRAGRIVEGHGDLRPEHVCLRPDLAIIDCLEFSRDLRIVDTLDEVGFLALECERLGAPDCGSVLLATYRAMSGDEAAPALIHFYQSYRAYMRARIAIWHLDEETFRYSAEWERRALDYLHLAERHLESC